MKKIDSLCVMLRKIYKDSLLKNSIYLIMTSFSTMALGFFFWIIVARYYAPNDVGMTSAIISSMTLISMISSVGFPTALSFYLPRDTKNADRIISSCLFVSVIISFILSLIFILGIDLWTPELKQTLSSPKMAIIFIAVTMMTAVSSLIAGAFTAHRRSSLRVIKETAFGLIKIIPLIVLAGFGAIGIFISWGIGLAFATIIGFILLYRIWGYSPKFTFDPIIKSMARFSIGNYIAGIFYSLPRLSLPIIIVSLISAESAGYYFIAMTAAGLLYGISYSISNSLLVESSDKEKLWKNVRKSIRFNMLLLIPGLILFVIFGRFILSMFNTGYVENSYTSLLILSLTSIPLSIINMYNGVRNSHGDVISTVKVNGFMAIITIVLSMPLMKTIGIEGAALAYLIGNTIGAIIVIIRIKNPTEFTLKLLRKKKDVVSI